MSLLRELRVVLAEVAQLAHSAPGRLTQGLRRWELRPHRPQPVGDPEVAYCFTCNTPWPCADAGRLLDEMAAGR